MRIADALLPEFDQEMANTRRVLERVPEARFSFKPHPKSFDMVHLATHLAEMVHWAADVMTTETFDFAPPGAPPYQANPATSSADLLRRFDESVQAARAGLCSASDERYMQPWSLLQGGNALFTMPRIVCIRSFVMNHCIHHRGQLTVYLRLNDVPVPAIYGPSADES